APPSTGPSQTPARPPATAPAPTTPVPQSPAMPEGPRNPELPGVPIYPTAEFLEAIDAGSGQRYYLYGTQTPYADIVGYYRTVLRSGGREIYRSPGVHQFELGR